MMDTSSILPSSSSFKNQGLIDQISDVLTDSILNGELKGRKQLKEMELQEYFQVSRSSIREAFRKLEKRGLVTIKPRRGTYLKAVTLESFQQNFTVRAVLEGLAAREAHPIMEEDDFEDLQLSLKEMKQAVAKNNIEQLLESIRRFHKVFIICSSNEAVISSLRNLPVHSTWKRFMGAYSTDEMQNVVRGHENILKHFLDRKCTPEKVESVVKAHLEASMRRIGGHLTKKQLLDP